MFVIYLLIVVIVVGAGLRHVLREIKEDDRRRRNDRLMARLSGGRRP